MNWNNERWIYFSQHDKNLLKVQHYNPIQLA